jgi:hypothetical protein
MFKSNNKLYVCLIAFVFLWVIASSFEYRDFRFSRILHPLLWTALGIVGLWLIRKKRYQPIRKKLVILFCLYLLISCWFLGSSVICRSEEGKIVYVNKKNRSNIIICRPYACFLTTGDCDYFNSWTIVGNLRWTRKLYTSKFDTTKWEPFNDESKNKYYRPSLK